MGSAITKSASKLTRVGKASAKPTQIDSKKIVFKSVSQEERSRLKVDAYAYIL